jgi:DNA-binding response OmpR family regulator
VRKSVLVVAQQSQLRARIARLLHSAGYSAELAENPKRALELAARKDIQAAIVVQSRDLAGLGQKLRDKIPTILVKHRTDEIVRYQSSDAHENIRSPARGISNNAAYRPRRIGLRPSEA